MRRCTECTRRHMNGEDLCNDCIHARNIACRTMSMCRDNGIPLLAPKQPKDMSLAELQFEARFMERKLMHKRAAEEGAVRVDAWEAVFE